MMSNKLVWGILVFIDHNVVGGYKHLRLVYHMNLIILLFWGWVQDFAVGYSHALSREATHKQIWY